MATGFQLQDTLFKQSTLSTFSKPLLPTSTVPTEDRPAFDTAAAWWMNETVMGDLLHLGTHSEAYSTAFSGDERDPGFNPYAFYEDNKAQYGDLESFVLDGTLGRARGPRQFDALAGALREELARREIIGESTGVEWMLGMATSLLDPSTFIPLVGWGARTAKVGTQALSTGAQVGAIVGAEEIVHQNVQHARTLYESAMAVGVSTVLGAGAGGLVQHLRSRGPGDSHYIGRGDNPLAEKNLGPHAGGSALTEPTLTGKGQAAQVAENGGGTIKFDKENGVTLAEGTPQYVPGQQVDIQKTRMSRAIDWTQGKVGWTRSPTTVATHTSSNESRNLLTSLAEMGLRTTQMAAGKARSVSAEIWKDVSVYAEQMSSEQQMVSAWEKLRKEQGAKLAVTQKLRSDLKEATTALGMKTDQNFISLADFTYLVQRRMRGGDITRTRRGIPTDATVIKYVDEAATGYSKFFEGMFKRALASGLLKEGQHIKSYLPQIWNRHAIIENPEKLKAAFRAKFQKRYEGKPDELNEFVDELVHKLSKGDHPGFQRDGFIHSEAFQIGKSKRTLSRELHIDGDELDDFEDFLIQDLTRLAKNYSDDMGGRVVLSEFFGKYAGKDDGLLKFEELANPMKAVKEEFKVLREKAASKLEREKIDRDEALVDQAVDNLRQRLLNIDRRGDHSDGALFAARTLRRVNFLRFMGSVMLASLTDLATISFSHGAFIRRASNGSTKPGHIPVMIKNMGRIAKEAKGMHNRELAFMLYGAEGTMSHARIAKLVGLDDEIARRGFGIGKTRSITSGIDASMDWMSNQMNYLNLMHWWNSRHKFITGHIVLGNLMDDAARLNRGAKLAKRGRRSGNYKWNELGLSDDHMKKIDELVQKHGFDQQVDGVKFRWPDTDKWLEEPGGMELVTALSAALKRSTDRAVITPSIADLPMFHSKATGQLLFQFNSFGFAAVNKFVRNLADEAVHGDAMSALIATTWSLGMGATAYYVRQGLIRGEELPDPTDEPATWAYEAIDRSGLLMYFMPYANSAMKLMAPHLQDMGIEITQPSRFSQQQYWQTFLGPSWGTATDTAMMGYYLSDGDWEKLGEKAVRMSPYRNVFWMEALLRKGWGED